MGADKDQEQPREKSVNPVERVARERLGRGKSGITIRRGAVTHDADKLPKEEKGKTIQGE